MMKHDELCGLVAVCNVCTDVRVKLEDGAVFRRHEGRPRCPRCSAVLRPQTAAEYAADLAQRGAFERIHAARIAHSGFLNHYVSSGD